ncbi:MAG TPA: hypothetical protein PLA71_00255 [Saccharofermentans sp.]|nr:hypothetical protein [Saccharofermentans sp.]
MKFTIVPFNSAGEPVYEKFEENRQLDTDNVVLLKDTINAEAFAYKNIRVIDGRGVEIPLTAIMNAPSIDALYGNTKHEEKLVHNPIVRPEPTRPTPQIQSQPSQQTAGGPVVKLYTKGAVDFKVVVHPDGNVQTFMKDWVEAKEGSYRILENNKVELLEWVELKDETTNESSSNNPN